MSIDHSSAFGTSIANAIDLPSGDHFSVPGASVTRVTCVVAPSASIHRTKTWVPLGSSAIAVYAIRVPSGDHTGPPPLTRNRFLVPSEFMIQIAFSHLSLTRSTQPRV